MDQSIKNWRAETRKRLLAQRTGLDQTLRARWDAAIAAHLYHHFQNMAGHTLGFYWPHRGEFDAREWVMALLEKGMKAALPVVAETEAPLVFHRWTPEAVMAPGKYGIPVPQQTEVTVPTVLLAPLMGFDEQGYRLGYGSGYFDRTLALMRPKPVTVGIGYEQARLNTITPQPHDIAMDFIVTELAVYQVFEGRLIAIIDANKAGPPVGYSSPACIAHEFDSAFPDKLPGNG